MAYMSLKKLFNMDASAERYSNNTQLARQRLTAESTYRLGFTTEAGELFLTVPHDLSLISERVFLRERDIAGRMLELPAGAQAALMRSLVVNEVVCTNDLEGIFSTCRQINTILEDETGGVFQTDENKRFRELAKLYLDLCNDRMAALPATPADIRAIYDRMMSGEDMSGKVPDGRLFRAGGVDIIGPGDKTVHRGIEPEQAIISALEDTLRIVNDSEMPILYKAMAGHYLFEYIHPFYDGNGRLGRYLLALHLKEALSPYTVLSLSREISEDRSRYYRLFKETEHPLNHGELTQFVIGMLEYVERAQEDLLADVAVYQAQLDTITERMDSMRHDHGLGRTETEIVYLLAQVAVFGVFPDILFSEIAQHVRLKDQMTRKHLRSLEEKKLVTAVNKRPLRFMLSPLAYEEAGISLT